MILYTLVTTLKYLNIIKFKWTVEFVIPYYCDVLLEISAEACGILNNQPIERSCKDF